MLKSAFTVYFLTLLVLIYIARYYYGLCDWGALSDDVYVDPWLITRHHLKELAKAISLYIYFLTNRCGENLSRFENLGSFRNF